MPLFNPTPSDIISKGYLWTLTMSNSIDFLNDIQVEAGEATDEAGAVVIILGNQIIKSIDASWAVGTGQGKWRPQGD